MNKLQTRGLIIQIPEPTKHGYCRISCPIFGNCELINEDPSRSFVFQKPGLKCPWGQVDSSCPSK